MFVPLLFCNNPTPIISLTMRHRPRRFGLLAISPLFVMAALFVALSIVAGGLSKVPILIVFVLTAVYALSITRGLPLSKRIALFSKGAGSPDLVLMLWIFIFAGMFATAAKEMGAIEATVNLALSILPSTMLVPSLFVAACFISMSIGTSVGTIVALAPIGMGLSEQTALPLSLITAAVVSGAFFGDNLSFISDTTIAATRTQACAQKDKFRANIRIALPAAIVAMLIYAFVGQHTDADIHLQEIAWIKVLPYLVVIVTALLGMNVLLVLSIGIFTTGIIGLATGTLTGATWISASAMGIMGMAELCLVSMMAGGLMELIRYNGGIIYLIHTLTRRVTGCRGAELSIATLVGLTNLCTANNTVAILSVGRLANDISTKYGVDKRRSASILDTVSCCVQSIIPYGAQLLIASGLTSLNPFDIIPYLFYPFVLIGTTLLAILWPRGKRVQ